ncbi:GNAT family N-acetyltransferase [Curtobacterium flaccumfaciens pv. flaccumfaciens]|jgi:GNAT superfamily N-acetyltransferase|uniref:GNAT family N-acetyltransferase n=1 Tax=Curtobacterium flaccumfaciens TaxID=2035 RepID=UPI001BDE4FBA|nr:GNAT family N-acetyltransferase [Curtobacterium flaccumfaciens]MBT1668134.1 GNAT family N-acetyltransferase [Curtobacterium flaccumfaciens pv. flaccumfaciens]
MGNEDDLSTLIRPATLADADAIAHVHTASWRETYGRFVADPDGNPWFDVARRVDMWRSVLAEPSTAGTIAVALDGTDVVGFGSAAAADDADAVRPDELRALYVLARAHGTGAGQGLLDAVLGDRPAFLWVAADNPRARSFYRRNGFEPDGAESAFGPIPKTVRLVR